MGAESGLLHWLTEIVQTKEIGLMQLELQIKMKVCFSPSKTVIGYYICHLFLKKICDIYTK